MKTYQEMYDEMKSDFTQFPQIDRTELDKILEELFVIDRVVKVIVYDAKYYEDEDTRLIAKEYVEIPTKEDKERFNNLNEMRSFYIERAHKAMGWPVEDCRVELVLSDGSTD